MPSLEENLEWHDEYPLNEQGDATHVGRISVDVIRVNSLPRSRRASRELSLGDDAEWWDEVKSCKSNGAVNAWWSGPVECAMQAVRLALKGACISAD